ncbi:hypothetical protein KKF05_04415, partial [Patescibacteria group bacterium]|nr:hypothetical protein [Patescibacteria group bacterium]MBU1916219.1 hypothetical protein [Patescibacteria group bacterium]
VAGLAYGLVAGLGYGLGAGLGYGLGAGLGAGLAPLLPVALILIPLLVLLINFALRRTDQKNPAVVTS